MKYISVSLSNLQQTCHTDPQAGIGFSECPKWAECVFWTTTTWVDKIWKNWNVSLNSFFFKFKNVFHLYLNQKLGKSGKFTRTTWVISRRGKERFGAKFTIRDHFYSFTGSIKKIWEFWPLRAIFGWKMAIFRVLVNKLTRITLIYNAEMLS